METVIRARNITKRFGQETALDDVSFEVQRGTVFALLGENGAGKTTAIRILLGLAEPDRGQAEVLGLASARQGLEIRRRVGYVSERPTLYEWMTVDAIGWFTAGFYPEGFLPRYRELARQFELPGKRKIKALSKGMRAKVSLALALAGNPELLVLDEPTSGLDAMVRREFLESMVDRAAAGQTVFLSSHQIGEVERVADIVAILRKGRLIVVEPLDRLKREVRELTFTLGDGVASPPEPPGDILSRRAKARQWQYLVRGLGDEQIAALSHDPAVRLLESRAPSLEEIFIAYMERGASGNGQVAEEVAVP
ncbi:MAG: ABC transporter ATP-binding protein [Thermoguttaceae bacterium]